jgi:hypothetical protein
VNASRVDEGLKGLRVLPGAARTACKDVLFHHATSFLAADEGNTSMIRGDLNKEDNGEE